jgi:outer membrane protein TolC
LFLFAAAFARPTDANASTVTLADCYALARKRAETLKQQEEAIFQAETRYRQALGSALPGLIFSASEFIQDRGGSSGSGNSNFTLRERPEAKFTLRQPLFSGFKEFAAMAGSKAEREKESLLLKYAERLLYMDVARAFYGALLFESDLANLDVLLSLTRERASELKERERLGKSRRSEVLLIESSQDAFQAQRISTALDRALAREMLSFLTGRELGDTSLDSDTAELPPLESEEDLWERARRRSDLRALAAQIEVQKHSARGARSSYYPSASATGNYFTRRAGAQRGIDWDVLVGLEIPLFGDAHLAFEIGQREARRQLREARLRLQASLDRARILQASFDKASESYRLQVGEYRRGLVNNLDVIQALNDMQDKKRDLDRARVQSRLDRIALEAVVEDVPPR